MKKEFNYLKERSKMFNSIGRIERYCDGINCRECPFNELREKYVSSFRCWEAEVKHPEEYEAIVRKWSEEHPVVTNREKFKEVFGFELTEDTLYDCVGAKCTEDANCSTCKYNNFWRKEYKGPVKEG